MRLSQRLNAIYQMVEENSIVADIGCDHGLLAIELILQKKAKHVYACDIRKGPLSKAIENITLYHFEDQITPLLKDGINDLSKDVDTIVIAGMGFETIQMILENNFNQLKNYKKIIIQCNQKVELLRGWIAKHCFKILQEDLVCEDFFYEIISFTAQCSMELSEEEVLFGKYLECHPLFLNYWQQRLSNYRIIYQQIPEGNKRKQELLRRCQQIEKKLKDITSNKE